MTDYWLIRRQRVAIAELYKLHGDYAYRSGANPRAVAAFAVTAIPTALVALVPAFAAAAPFAWPIGVVLGAAVYYPLMRNQPVPGTVPTAPDEYVQ
jgi:NCS1 family nucleobase:cation symporter-1